MTDLSNVKPDFESLVQQLNAALSNKDAWTDLVLSGTGQTLIEFLAGIGTMLSFNVERGVQEVFMDTANLDTSIISIARTLGVNPQRRVSGKTTVTLNLTNGPFAGSVTIPALSQFDIEGVAYYNSEDITFAASTTQLTGIILEQGEIQTQNFTGNGNPFQKFIFGQKFTINENLMKVVVDSTTYTRERRSFFQFTSTDTVFLEDTLPDGSIRVSFPNDKFGTVPANGASIAVTFAESLGLEGNNASTNLTVNLTSTIVTGFGTLSVSGVTTAGTSGGQAKEDPEELRFTAPRIFASADRAITRQDWKSISLRFTDRNIVDALAVGEFELAPTDNTRMNESQVTLLPADDTTFTSVQVETGDGATTAFGFTLEFTVKPSSISITDTVETFTDDGAGVLTGDQGGSGTVNYLTGVVSITFNSAPLTSQAINATYVSIGLTATQRASYLTFIDEFKHVNTGVNIENPEQVLVNITAEIFYFDQFDANQLQTTAQAALETLFSRRLGALGRDYFISDIIEEIVKLAGVDYVTLTTPSSPINLTITQFAVLNNVNLTMTLTSR